MRDSHGGIGMAAAVSGSVLTAFSLRRPVGYRGKDQHLGSHHQLPWAEMRYALEVNRVDVSHRCIIASFEAVM